MVQIPDNSITDSESFGISNKFKVLRIIARMNIGGPAVQVTGLMRELDKSIFDQKLLTGFVADDEADYLIENDIQIPATRIHGLGRSISLAADIRAFLKIVKEIRQFKPDIIHTHTAKAGVLGRTAWIFAGYKPKLVHTYHGHLLHGYFGKNKTRLVILIEKILGFFTNELFAVGDIVKQDLINAGIGNPKKFRVMPPGLEIGQIPDRHKICEKYKLNNEYFYCTFLGRITEIKKPFRFLEVAAKLKDKKNIHFLLIGSGELLTECNEIIKENSLPVTSLGWITQVEEALAVTDLMLLTSDNEGMPLSLIQAGMAGIPSISTDVGSVKEVIQNEKTGYVLDFNVSSFSQKIIELHDDYGLRAQLGEFAANFTKSNFNLQRLANDHKQAYLSLFN